MDKLDMATSPCVCVYVHVHVRLDAPTCKIRCSFQTPKTLFPSPGPIEDEIKNQLFELVVPRPIKTT